MFAAQRDASTEPFHLICVNTAHTRATGLDTSQIAGLRPSDILPNDEGRKVEARYESCVTLSDVIHYNEELHLSGRLTHWHTTLMPVKLDCGGDRVIGTALTLGLPVVTDDLSDAEYYAAQVQMRLGQIGQFLRIIQEHPETPQDLRTGAIMMEGLNHSLDHLLQDLRLATQSRPPARVDTRNHLQLVS